MLAIGVAAALVPLRRRSRACVPTRRSRERLDDADAAVVGRVVAERTGETKGAPQRLLTVEVDQRVKGDVGRHDRRPQRRPGPTAICSSPRTRRSASCSRALRTAPGSRPRAASSHRDQLVAEGGEPRGGVIKVVLGIVILGLVLLWALRRLTRGARPDLPALRPRRTLARWAD